MTLRQSPSGALESVAVGDLDPTGSTSGQVPTSTGPDTPPAWADGGGGGGDVAPLSRTYYVDPNTETPILEQDGSIAAPFFTLTYALEVVLAGPFSESLFLLVAWDYSAEPALVIPTNVRLQLQGLPRAGIGGTNANPVVGDITQTLGGEQGKLTLVNLECGGTWELAGEVECIGCVGIAIAPGSDGVDPSPVAFTIRGGSVASIDAAAGTVDGATFGPSPVTIDLTASPLTVTNSELGGMAPTVTFAEEGGVVRHDLQTEGTAGVVPPFVVNLGETERLALPVQVLVGTTVQQQLNSIAAALVALGLAIDSRTP